MLSLNVLIDDWCEGCDKHSYPYKSQVPISGLKSRVFKSDQDVFDVIKLLIKETKEINLAMGKNFDISSSIYKQLPHFACINIALNSKFQKDISKYLYCQKFNIPAYKGTYGDQPYKWIQKCNIIESSINKRNDMLRKKAELEVKNG